MEWYWDCSGGISGDMTLAALAHLGVDFAPLTALLARAGVACDITWWPEQRAGGPGCRADVQWRAEAQPLRHPADIAAIFARVAVDEPVRRRALAVLDALAQAEAHAHRIPVEDVHFHEVGAVDTLVDILGVCWGMGVLGVTRVTCSPLPWFDGSIDCAHGRIPLPAPAAARLMEGKPVRPSGAHEELVTPTGAALVHVLADGFADGPCGCLGRLGTGYGSRPAPNGLLDLWSQVYLLDGGERLGKTLTVYRDTYFNPGRRGPQGVVYEWIPKEGAEEAIYKKLEGLCISMDSKDHLELPDRLFIPQEVELPQEARGMYQTMRRDMLLPFRDGDVDAATAAILSNKLLQMAGGAVYDENGKVQTIHEAKLEKMDQLIEEANGQPVLVFYNYTHERDRLKARYPYAVEIKDDGAIDKWDAGQAPILLANPASAGHGLNLQFGGHIIIWYSPTWNYEFYDQANKRLHRPGQTETVLIHLLIAKGTMDERVVNVVLKEKEAGQDKLLEALRAEIMEAA